jgi:hypothetical protein
MPACLGHPSFNASVPQMESNGWRLTPPRPSASGMVKQHVPPDRYRLAGVVLGGMYALVAMGLTLQYGVARIMNLSHGESLIAAAFGALWGFATFRDQSAAGLIVAIPSVSRSTGSSTRSC